MDIHHKRHVFQGWREFLKEVGIIVLGVLIALGAEQIAVAVHEARTAARAEALVRDEFALNVAFARERVASTPCMLSRLDELRRVLLKTSDKAALPNLGEIGHVPERPFEWEAWKSMVSAGLVDHLTDQQRWSYQHVYPALRGSQGGARRLSENPTRQAPGCSPFHPRQDRGDVERQHLGEGPRADSQGGGIAQKPSASRFPVERLDGGRRGGRDGGSNPGTSAPFVAESRRTLRFSGCRIR